jgi:hypothetical protein
MGEIHVNTFGDISILDPSEIKGSHISNVVEVGKGRGTQMKHKCIKKNKDVMNLVLGENVKLNEVSKLACVLLVGRF